MLRLLGRRALCTAALPEAAPITMFGTSGRYANAIYAAAAKNKALGDVADDLALLKETLSASPTLHNFCINPSISREVKAKGIVDLLTSAKASTTTKNAMATLAEGGRMGDVYKVIDMYTDLITAAKGEVKAVITSAEPLPADEMSAIKAQLNSFLVRAAHRRPGEGGGKGGQASQPLRSAMPCPTCQPRPAPVQEPGQTKINLTTTVDASLISGITVEIGDKFLDASVATQLKKLQGLLKDNLGAAEMPAPPVFK